VWHACVKRWASLGCLDGGTVKLAVYFNTKLNPKRFDIDYGYGVGALNSLQSCSLHSLVHWADMPLSPRTAGGGILPLAHQCVYSFVWYKPAKDSLDVENNGEFAGFTV
jgi:hypothetical protein